MAPRFEYTQAEEIRQGKDFIQIKNGPFDIDLIFAPNGFETFAKAWLATSRPRATTGSSLSAEGGGSAVGRPELHNWPHGIWAGKVLRNPGQG
jgi:hypothetical protein